MYCICGGNCQVILPYHDPIKRVGRQSSRSGVEPRSAELRAGAHSQGELFMLPRMRASGFCFSILLITLLVAAVNRSDPGKIEADRKAIIELEKDWLGHESDAPTLNRILAEDFIHPVSQGIFLTKRQHIAWSVKHPRPPGHKARFENLDVRVYAETAIANGIVEASDVPDEQPKRTVFSDVFVYRAGRWQAVNAQENAMVE
jgi:hypothetical protein